MTVFISGSWMHAYPGGKAAAVDRLRTAAAESARQERVA
jgi:ribulose-phosphate 3-epimerase